MANEPNKRICRVMHSYELVVVSSSVMTQVSRLHETRTDRQTRDSFVVTDQGPRSTYTLDST
jgi:hypothetical protein